MVLPLLRERAGVRGTAMNDVNRIPFVTRCGMGKANFLSSM
jgi:hypothetical protein